MVGIWNHIMISKESQDCSTATPVIVVLSELTSTPSIIKDTTVMTTWLMSIHSETVDSIDITNKASRKIRLWSLTHKLQYYPRGLLCRVWVKAFLNEYLRSERKMPKRPAGSSQGGKGPMKKMKRYTAKRMNYVPLRWISKQNRPFRATIPINPFPPVYRTKVTWAPPATVWTPGSGNAVIQFKLNSVFDCELSSSL